MSGGKQLEQTLTETQPTSGGGAGVAWLIHVGSAENGFRDAGVVFKLDGVRKVRFGRGTGGNLESEEHFQTGGRKLLQIGIPLGWVSGTHAELRVIDSDGGVEFELRDLGSRNGTLIENRAIGGGGDLHPGQVFEVGRSFWMVREVPIADLEPQVPSTVDPAGTCTPELCHVYRQLERLAPSSVPLLLYGETGTGKQTVAASLHALSGRDGPLIRANLSTVGSDRVASMLFGQGTGADATPGLFERADRGTLLLEELGELSDDVQAQLTAALAAGQVVRIGDDTKRNVDTRIVCTTLHDLRGMVQHGRFRPDLYSRLAGFEADLSSLRERRADLGLLLRRVLKDRAPSHARLTTRAFRRLLAHRWPFNIRELAQLISAASILSGAEGEITPAIVDDILQRHADVPESSTRVHDLRRELVSRLAEFDGDMSSVAKAMARDRKEIQRWIERFELVPEEFKQ